MEEKYLNSKRHRQENELCRQGVKKKRERENMGEKTELGLTNKRGNHERRSDERPREMAFRRIGIYDKDLKMCLM